MKIFGSHIGIKAIAPVFVLTTLATPFLTTETTSARSARTCSSQYVASHRGVVDKRMTENTIGAFKQGIREGAKTVETDLRLTKDGRWVLMHDATINRTMKGSGHVSNMTVDQLMKYRSRDGRGQRIPTAHNFFKAMPNSLGYQLEIKTSYPSKKQLNNLVAAVRAKQPNPDKVFFTSNKLHILEYLSKAAPEYKRGLIMVDDNRIPVSKIPAYVDSVNMLDRVATKSYIAEAHRAGKQVLARSADSPSDWNRLIGANVDRLVTDNMSGYTSWCRSVRR